MGQNNRNFMSQTGPVQPVETTQGPSERGAMPPPPGAPATFTNSAPNDPNLTYLMNRLRGRIDGDMGQNAATITMGQRIGEFAEGQRSAVRGNLSRRGMLSNSGSEGEQGSEIGVAAGAQFAQKASEIGQDAERRRDAMILGAGGIFAEPGRQNLAERSMGLNQWQAQQQAALQQQALLAQQQQQNFQNQLSARDLALRQQQAMWSNYGGGGGGVVSSPVSSGSSSGGRRQYGWGR